MNEQSMSDQLLAMLNADTEDFLELAKMAGLDIKRDFSGADLSGVNLANADLTGCDFSYADLSNANLSNTNLTRANLRNASFVKADLTGATLVEADLRGSNFLDAKIQDTIFAGSQTTDARNLSSQSQYLNRGKTELGPGYASRAEFQARLSEIRRLRLTARLLEMAVALARVSTALTVIPLKVIGILYDLMERRQRKENIDRAQDRIDIVESRNASTIRAEQAARAVERSDESYDEKASI